MIQEKPTVGPPVPGAGGWVPVSHCDSGAACRDAVGDWMTGSNSPVPGRGPVVAMHACPVRSWRSAVPGCCDAGLAGRAGARVPPFMTRPGHGLNGLWPLQDFLELGALVSAVPCARLHSRQVFWEWGLASLGENAELLVTELMTNAVKASRAVKQASPVCLWLVSDGAQILILVWDASPQPPVRMDARRRGSEWPWADAGGGH
jgi:anti-sigma regulatory factor (Ser/Thr protein kinase)